MVEKHKVVIVDYDMVTAYGRGVDACWQGLMKGETAIKEFDRFLPYDFSTRFAAMIQGLKSGGQSYVWQMLEPLLETVRTRVPRDAFLILATAVGEIDCLERSVLAGAGPADLSALSCLEEKIRKFLQLDQPGMVVSTACASAGAALAQAGRLISCGKKDCCLVVACDSVSEFVYSGFSSLMGLDKQPARPFDAKRAGLSLGEGAGFILLMSEPRAASGGRERKARLCGWGLSNDAIHMTSPSRDGEGLSLAIRQALRRAGISAEDVGSISAHGTGTPYNDSMEMKAFKKVFSRPLPAYSIKGGTGHTLGAAGLVEAIVSIKSLQEKTVPLTVGLDNVDPEAAGWVGTRPKMCENPVALSVNAGFGGVNAALIFNV